MLDILYYKFRQNLAIKHYPQNTEHLVIYLVDSHDGINGGYLSIFSMCEQSRRLFENSKTVVLMSTYPGIKYTRTRYTKFKNNEFIYRFKLITEHFTNVQHLVLHVPEYWSKHLLTHLSDDMKKWFFDIPTRHINILNQNIEQMPENHLLSELKKMSTLFTVTTAHHRYTTPAYRDAYQCPIHLLTTYVDPCFYHARPYSEKSNIIVYSNDDHPSREKILALIKEKLPQFELIKIHNMTYETYKDLMSRAKFSITFGEGFDNYFIEAYFSGSIGLSVFNPLFFPDPSFKQFPSVFENNETWEKTIVDTIQSLDNATAYSILQHNILEILSMHYSFERYKNRLKAFYAGEYDLLYRG